MTVLMPSPTASCSARTSIACSTRVYITVTPELCLEVGTRLRDEYHNGRSYYPLHGARLHLPAATAHQPRREFLEWHNEHVFRG